MKISETVNGFIQPVKTSFETARTKASETVAKASEIAQKILKVLFTPVTYLYNHAKSFYDKMRTQPAPSDAGAPGFEPVDDSADSTGAGVLPASAVSVSADDTSLDKEIGLAIQSLFTGPDADSTDAVEDVEEPVATSYTPLEQLVFENLKAEILGTDETLDARLAREEFKREKERQKSIPFDPEAPTIAQADTQNSLKAENYQAAIGLLDQIVPQAVAQAIAQNKDIEWPALNGERQNKSAMRRAHSKG